MTSQQDNERAKEDAKISNDFARYGSQATILINGGAATATLAFLSGRESTIARLVFPLVPIPLAAYSVGVFVAAISLLIMSQSIECYMVGWREPGNRRKWHSRGTRLWWFGLGLVTVGLLCFVAASIYLAYGLGSIVIG